MSPLASTEKPTGINLKDEIVGEVAEKLTVINLGDDMMGGMW